GATARLYAVTVDEHVAAAWIAAAARGIDAGAVGHPADVDMFVVGAGDRPCLQLCGSHGDGLPSFVYVSGSAAEPSATSSMPRNYTIIAQMFASPCGRATRPPEPSRSLVRRRFAAARQRAVDWGVSV